MEGVCQYCGRTEAHSNGCPAIGDNTALDQWRRGYRHGMNRDHSDEYGDVVYPTLHWSVRCNLSTSYLLGYDMACAEIEAMIEAYMDSRW